MSWIIVAANSLTLYFRASRYEPGGRNLWQVIYINLYQLDKKLIDTDKLAGIKINN